MHVAKLIGYEYYEFTEAITTVCIFFIILSLSSAKLINVVENYVRNIFYDIGVVSITDTGSFNGSVNQAGAAADGGETAIADLTYLSGD